MAGAPRIRRERVPTERGCISLAVIVPQDGGPWQTSLKRAHPLDARGRTIVGVVTFTANPAVDQNTSVDRVVPEHKLRCAPPKFDPGGGGINVARAVMRLAGDATAVWTRGGAGGDLLEHLLDQAGVPHRPVAVQGETRINVSVREVETNEQYRFGMPGPRLTEAELGACIDAVHAACADCGFLVFSGSLPPGVPSSFYRDLVEATADRDVQVVVDSHGEPLKQAVQAGVYMIKPNRKELAELVERELQDDDAVAAAARSLIDAGRVQVVVVSLGSDGALLVTKDATTHVPAPQVEVQSRIGAGDSMVAGIVVALSQGRTLDEAVRYGVAAGAAAALRRGTQLSRAEDTERLFEQTR